MELLYTSYVVTSNILSLLVLGKRFVSDLEYRIGQTNEGRFVALLSKTSGLINSPLVRSDDSNKLEMRSDLRSDYKVVREEARFLRRGSKIGCDD